MAINTNPINAGNMNAIGDYKYSAVASNTNGWLLCNGGAISRSVYSALFAIIGTSFGAGDGSTTFNLPDFRGRVAGGIGQGTDLSNRTLGQSVGVEKHTLTLSEIPSHKHSVQGYVRGDYDANDVFSNYQGLDTGSNRYYTDNQGGGQAHNNMQPTLFGGNVFIFGGV